MSGIIMYCCHNSLHAGDPARSVEQKGIAGVRMIELPCSSRLEPIHILKAFEGGADGVVVVACPENRCALLDGSRRAAGRVEFAQKLMAEAGLESERLMFFTPEPPAVGEIGRIASEAKAVVGGLEGPSKKSTRAGRHRAA